MTDEQTMLGTNIEARDADLGTNVVQAPTRTPRAKKAAEGLPATRRVILEENDNIPPTGLFVGVNGQGFLIKPGEAVDLPVSVLEVLDNSITSTPVRSQDGEVLGYRDKTQYPYRYAKTPS